MAVFGSGSSPGSAMTNYGDIQLTIKNPSCTTNESTSSLFSIKKLIAKSV